MLETNLCTFTIGVEEAWVFAATCGADAFPKTVEVLLTHVGFDAAYWIAAAALPS